MEKATGAESLLDKIRPPRLEDAGLEDCALPPESIKEAFLKAASAVRSLVSDDGEDESDRGPCVDDPWEESSDALVGITEGVNAPSEGCAGEKGGGLTDAPGDAVVSGRGDGESKPDAVVAPGPTDDGRACGSGVGIEGKDKVCPGKNSGGDVAEEDDEGERDKPTLVEGYA